MPRKTKEETALTRALKDAADKLPGVKLVRVHSGRVQVRRGWMHLAPEGTADLLGQFHGRALAVEAKTDAGEQDEKQRDFAREWMKLGGLYWVIRSTEQFAARVAEEAAA